MNATRAFSVDSQKRAGDSGEGCVKVLTHVVLPQGKIKNLSIFFKIGLQACNNGAGDSGEGCIKVLTYVVLPQGKIKNLSIFF